MTKHHYQHVRVHTPALRHMAMHLKIMHVNICARLRHTGAQIVHKHSCCMIWFYNRLWLALALHIDSISRNSFTQNLGKIPLGWAFLLTLKVRGPSYLSLTRSLSWLLMPWLLTSPGHQQSWYFLCRIGRFLSYLRKDLNYLWYINMEKWHKL